MNPAVTGVQTDECKDPAYKRKVVDFDDKGRALFWRPNGDIRWKLNRDSIPDYMDKDRTLDRLRQGGTNFTSTNTECAGYGDVAPNGIWFNYDGVDNDTTSKITKGDPDCPDADNVSIVHFGSYNRGGVTCSYAMGRKGRYYIIREVDVKLRSHPQGEGTHWFTTNGPSDACEQDADLYDLEGTMTHERGHSLGLTHVLPLGRSSNLDHEPATRQLRSRLSRPRQGRHPRAPAHLRDLGANR